MRLSLKHISGLRENIPPLFLCTSSFFSKLNVKNITYIMYYTWNHADKILPQWQDRIETNLAYFLKGNFVYFWLLKDREINNNKYEKKCIPLPM